VRLDPQVFLDGFDLEEILVLSEPCTCSYSSLIIFDWIPVFLRICIFWLLDHKLVLHLPCATA
jgi:hypothetical protein